MCAKWDRDRGTMCNAGCGAMCVQSRTETVAVFTMLDVYKMCCDVQNGTETVALFAMIGVYDMCCKSKVRQT